MDQQFLTEMENKLRELKAGLVEVLVKEDESFNGIINDNGPKDSADLASGDMDKQLISVLGKNDLNRLKKIDSALSRIKNDHYGKCLSCGKKITKERLEAIPYAVFCIDCQSGKKR
jgi:RNA polymerase-binding protein DksA